MQDRATRTREALLDAAAAVVDRSGYDGASLSEVLALAGVTKGAMYHHFGSKAALVKALVEEQFAPALTSPTVDGMPVLHAAEVSVQALVATVDDVRFRAAFGVVIDRPHPDLGPWSRPVTAWEEAFTELVELACARGDLLTDVAPRDEAAAIVAMVVGQFCVARAVGDQAASVRGAAVTWERFIDRAVAPNRRVAHHRGLQDLLGTYLR